MLEENNYPNYEGENLDHMRLANEKLESAGLNTAKKKKSRRPMGAKTKSAVNGIIFGVCASLVFCSVTAIGNRTFLKPQTANATYDTASEVESKKEIPTSDTADRTDSSAATAVPTANQTESHLSVSQIAQNAMPAVVSITTKGVEEVRSMFGTRQYESQGAGSGIIIGQNETELFIATNKHVVSGAQEVSVCFDDSNENAVVTAQVKGADASNDLAILSVSMEDISAEIRAQIKVIAIGDSKELKVGDQVVAIGNALGYGQSVTTGIVSALDREVDIDQYTSKLIQTDAAINPGNSGGALLNMKGELIGINSAKYASETVEGMGYAIPIDTAKPILDNLISRETRQLASDQEAGYLGVSCQDVSQEAVQYYDMPKGVYIAEVEEAGAAQKAGIRKGDIITKFDGLSVTSSQELRDTIAYYKQGETVEVVLMRANNGEYQEQTVSVTLAKSEAMEKQKQQEAAKQLDPKDGLKLPYDMTEPNNDENSASDEESSLQDETQDSAGDNAQMPEQVQRWFEQFFQNGGF